MNAGGKNNNYNNSVSSFTDFAADNLVMLHNIANDLSNEMKKKFLHKQLMTCLTSKTKLLKLKTSLILS